MEQEEKIKNLMALLNTERIETVRLREQNERLLSELNALRHDKEATIAKLTLERDFVLKESARLNQHSKQLEAQLIDRINEIQTVQYHTFNYTQYFERKKKQKLLKFI